MSKQPKSARRMRALRERDREKGLSHVTVRVPAHRREELHALVARWCEEHEAAGREPLARYSTETAALFPPEQVPPELRALVAHASTRPPEEQRALQAEIDELCDEITPPKYLPKRKQNRKGGTV